MSFLDLLSGSKDSGISATINHYATEMEKSTRLLSGLTKEFSTPFEKLGRGFQIRVTFEALQLNETNEIFRQLGFSEVCEALWCGKDAAREYCHKVIDSLNVEMKNDKKLDAQIDKLNKASKLKREKESDDDKEAA